MKFLIESFFLGWVFLNWISDFSFLWWALFYYRLNNNNICWIWLTFQLFSRTWWFCSWVPLFFFSLPITDLVGSLSPDIRGALEDTLRQTYLYLKQKTPIELSVSSNRIWQFTYILYIIACLHQHHRRHMICAFLGIFQWHYDLTETSEYVGHNWPNYPHEQKFRNVYQILYTCIAYFLYMKITIFELLFNTNIGYKNQKNI